MSLDMSQFHGVFFEESQEHLTDMETLLMDLSVDAPDKEQLNSIFRAAHSIKGGSGVFGFNALTGITHVMENLFDLARNDQIVLTKEIIDELLIGVDTLNNVLNAYQQQSDIDQDAIDKCINALETILNNVQQGESNQQQDTQAESAESAPAISDEEAGFGFFDDEFSDNNSSESDSGDEEFALFGDEDDKPAKDTSNDEEQFGFFTDLDNPHAELDAPKPAATPTTAPKPRQSSVAAKSKPAAKSNIENSSIRVDTQKIDSLVNLVGELVITQSMLTLVGEELQGESEEKLGNALGELSRNINHIQEAVMSMRMLPVSFVFNRFPRLVRDLAGKMKKDIQLLIEGGDTEIDKGLIEKLVDPLTHLVRNCVDHGIESPEKREQAGKDAKGTITLSAGQRGGNILLSISDDGGGLDREKILSKAASSGLDVSDDMPDEKVWMLIFEPGFSTADTVTDISGRGVGMDVVKRNLEAIGGSVDIQSSKGVGSSFDIRLPLTLAIVDGMCVLVGEQTFVVPLTNVIESLQVSSSQIKTIQNEQVLWIRGEYWPLVALHKTMNIDNAISDPTQAIVVLVETSRKRFGILVDSLDGQQQVVIKSLEQHYKPVAGVSGATIMGDGSVSLIVDIESLATNVSTVNVQEVPIAS